MRYGSWSLFGLGVFLAGMMSAGLAGGETEAVPLPEMVVSKTLVPPTIDGKIAPGEWDRAPATTAFVTAFHGNLSKIQSIAQITYDDQFIYVYIKNYRGPNYTFLSKRARETDDVAIVFDYSNEIWITPPVTPATTYQALFNSYPGVFDVKMIPSVGYTAKSWNGNWIIASSETADHWIVEAKGPIKSFGLDRVQDGSTWRALFCTDVLGGAGFTAWAPGGAFADIVRHGFLHMRDKSPVFQLLDIESIFSGKFAFPAAVTGPVEGRSEVAVTLRFGQSVKPTEGDMVLTKTVTVENGKREEFTLAGDLTALKLPQKKVVVSQNPRVEKEVPAGFCEVTAKSADGTVLYHQVFPFEIDGYKRTPPAQIKTTPYEAPFGLEAFYAPLNKKLIVKIDRYYMPDRDEVAGGSARLVDPRTGRVVAERTIAAFSKDYSQFPMDLAAVEVPVETEEVWRAMAAVKQENAKIAEENKKLEAEGKPGLPLKPLPFQPAVYTLQVTLSAKDGKELATHSITVPLKGYQFEWLPNNVGISDKVIPPWTPIEWKGGELVMWNKTYRLDGLGLAEKITNAGAPQLSGPMRLVATLNGRVVAVTKVARPSVERLTEAAADLTGTATFGDLEIQTRTHVEFDGFVLNTMSLVPRRPTNLDVLSLVVTMPKAEAPCFVTTAGGWSAYHGWTPEKWTSMETSSGSIQGNFVPYVFLTDSDRGFCWFADTEKGWLLDPAKPTLELETKGETVTLRVNFVTKSGVVAKPTSMTYGWMVTPQKPQPKGWRAYHVAYAKPYPQATCMFWCDADWAVLWPYYSSPYPWDYEKSKKALEGGNIVKCVGNIAHAIARYRDYKGRQFNEIAADWGEVIGDLSNGNVARSRGPNDFQVWHWDQWVKKSGLSGLYFDETYLSEDRNYLTGGAYLLPDERIQPGYSYIALRDMFKRLRYVFHENGKAMPNLWLHTTSGHPVYAWMPDMSFEGENVEPVGGENDYLDAYPASRFRSIGMGRNLGSAPIIMCQADRHWNDATSPYLVMQFVGWVLAHDCLPEGSALWTVLAQELEVWRDDIRFLPYWKAGLGIESRTNGVVVSAHSRPGHAVLWIVNTTWQDRTAVIRLDLEKLGLDAKRTIAYDAETGERYALGGQQLNIGVPKRFWRAVRLAETPPDQPDATLVAGPKGFETEDGQVRAAWALGRRFLYAAGNTPKTERLPGGETVVSLEQPVSIPARQHVARERGVIELALIGDPASAAGTLLSVGDLAVTLGDGKLTLRTGKQQQAADWRPAANAFSLALRWKGSELVLCEAGKGEKTILAAKLDTPMPIQPPGRGYDIIDWRKNVLPTQITFGPMKGASLAGLILKLEDKH